MPHEAWRELSHYYAELPPELLTPALAIYPQAIRKNIRATLRLLGGDAARWRPHLKTVKAAFIMRLMVEEGLFQAKCATPLELQTACEAGMTDIVLAMPLVGAAIAKVISIAKSYPKARVSSLVESLEHVEGWRNSGLPLYIDINPGMNRTGIEQFRKDEVVAIAQKIKEVNCSFAGVHYYDGHLTDLNLEERTRLCHQGYNQLMSILKKISSHGLHVPEVITSGSTSFPCSLSFEAFKDASFRHVCSPGTIILNDLTSLSQLPEEFGYLPAALVLASVMSKPTATSVTLDAGHKAVSVDLGVPSGFILGHPNAVPLKPSEEHLPVDMTKVSKSIALGSILSIVPRHVCTTMNNFNTCIVIEEGRVTGVEPITARGRHAAL